MLMQCQIDAWNKLGELEKKVFYTVDVDGDDPNDNTCSICGDGGDLICCDNYPSTCHPSCLDIEMLPEGDWLCPNCSCKYCGMAGGNCTKMVKCHEVPVFIAEIAPKQLQGLLTTANQLLIVTGVSISFVIGAVFNKISNQFGKSNSQRGTRNADIKGHRRIYIGSTPGRLIDGLKVPYKPLQATPQVPKDL